MSSCCPLTGPGASDQVTQQDTWNTFKHLHKTTVACAGCPGSAVLHMSVKTAGGACTHRSCGRRRRRCHRSQGAVSRSRRRALTAGMPRSDSVTARPHVGSAGQAMLPRSMRSRSTTSLHRAHHQSVRMKRADAMSEAWRHLWRQDCRGIEALHNAFLT